MYQPMVKRRFGGIREIERCDYSDPIPRTVSRGVFDTSKRHRSEFPILRVLPKNGERAHENKSSPPRA